MRMSHDIVTWNDSDWHVQNQNWKRHQAQENARRGVGSGDDTSSVMESNQLRI